MTHKEQVLAYWLEGIALLLRYAVGSKTPSYWMERAEYCADQYAYTLSW